MSSVFIARCWPSNTAVAHGRSFSTMVAQILAAAAASVSGPATSRSCMPSPLLPSLITMIGCSAASGALDRDLSRPRHSARKPPTELAPPTSTPNSVRLTASWAKPAGPSLRRCLLGGGFVGGWLVGGSLFGRRRCRGDFGRSGRRRLCGLCGRCRRGRGGVAAAVLTDSLADSCGRLRLDQLGGRGIRRPHHRFCGSHRGHGRGRRRRIC